MQHLYQMKILLQSRFVSRSFSFLGLIPIKVVLISIKIVLSKQTNLMKLDYYYSLTAKSNLNITVGNTNSYQDYNSSIYQLFDNGTHLILMILII
jgi:hypothetical protein